MTISMHFFHVLTFVLLFSSFPFSFAHYRDVNPLKESPSIAPSPKLSSGSSNGQCPCTCPAPEPSNDSGNTASSGSAGASSGSGSSSFSWSSSFEASAGSKFSGSGSSTASASMGPSSSGSSSDAFAPMSSSSSDSNSTSSSDSSTGSGSDVDSGSWSAFSDYTGSSDSSASSPASGPSSWSGSDSSTGGSPTSSSSGDSSESEDSTTSGSSDGGSSTNSGSSGGSGSSDANIEAGDSSGGGGGGGSDSDSSTDSGSSNGPLPAIDVASPAGADISGGSSGSQSGDNNIAINFSGTFKKILAFGDSYTDTGNAQILGTVKSFVGSYMTKLFQTRHPNFNLVGRSSNGRLVVDFLCDALNISTLPPYKAISANANAIVNFGVNFAIGGATSLSADIYSNNRINNNLLWQGIPPGFQTQIEWFNNYIQQIACKGKSDEECRQEIAGHLIWFGQMGIDDYSRILGSAVSLRWLAEVTIDNISKLLTAVLDSGAKTIVVQGLPPLGCCPIAKAFTPNFLKDEMGCAAIINKAIIAHNELLQSTLEQLRQRYTDCSIGYADFFKAYKTIMGNIGTFGFQDGSSACCGIGGGLNFNLQLLCGMAGAKTCKNPGAYIHWDGIHLTEAMHKQITDLFLNKGFIKPSFASLCSGKSYGN